MVICSQEKTCGAKKSSTDSKKAVHIADCPHCEAHTISAECRNHVCLRVAPTSVECLPTGS